LEAGDKALKCMATWIQDKNTSDLDPIGSQEENATIVFNVTDADVIKRF